MRGSGLPEFYPFGSWDGYSPLAAESPPEEGWANKAGRKRLTLASDRMLAAPVKRDGA